MLLHVVTVEFALKVCSILTENASVRRCSSGNRWQERATWFGNAGKDAEHWFGLIVRLEVTHLEICNLLHLTGDVLERDMEAFAVPRCV